MVNVARIFVLFFVVGVAALVRKQLIPDLPGSPFIGGLIFVFGVVIVFPYR